MIQLIISDFNGNLVISNDQITSDSPFSLSEEDGGKRTLFPGDKNCSYYDSDRIFIISVVNSTGSIELVGTFTKPVKVYLYDRNDITVYPSINFKSNQLEIRHMKGGLDALIVSEPSSWLGVSSKNLLTSGIVD